MIIKDKTEFIIQTVIAVVEGRRDYPTLKSQEFEGRWYMGYIHHDSNGDEFWYIINPKYKSVFDRLAFWGNILCAKERYYYKVPISSPITSDNLNRIIELGMRIFGVKFVDFSKYPEIKEILGGKYWDGVYTLLKDA